jgi:hypothetical protein
MKKYLVCIILFFLLSMNLTCQKKSVLLRPPNPNAGIPVTESNQQNPEGSIVSETIQELAETEISPGGGTVIVIKPGNVLQGMKIEVPTGSYPTTQKFIISSTAIQSHPFGANFKPITPLIKVENGGTYSEKLMIVTVPISLAEDEFAMPFFYNQEKGKLEGIPLISENTTSLTFATRHFSTFVISAIRKELLKGDLKSTFMPTLDNWSLPNSPTQISPKGECAGQAISSLWYFLEKKQVDQKELFNRYDNDGKEMSIGFWQDDRLALRLVSTVHTDLQWDKSFDILYDPLTPIIDELTWLSFAYSMLLTHEPQLVVIKNTQSGEGHAMVVYQVKENGLVIADPNKPWEGQEILINYEEDRFKPYEGYNRILYIGKYASIEPSQIEKRWKELDKGTIGNDRFIPAAVYHIGRKAGNRTLDLEMKDKYMITDNVEKDEIKIAVVDPNNKNKWYSFDVYDYSDPANPQLIVDKVPNDPVKLCPLKKGDNKLGFVIWAYNTTNQKYLWADFKHIVITYNKKEETNRSGNWEMGCFTLPSWSIWDCKMKDTYGFRLCITIKNGIVSGTGSTCYSHAQEVKGTCINDQVVFTFKWVNFEDDKAGCIVSGTFTGKFAGTSSHLDGTVTGKQHIWNKSSTYCKSYDKEFPFSEPMKD